jgi:dipeptidase D
VTAAELRYTEPRLLWARFSELARVARPPGREQVAIDHVRDWAASLGLEAASAGGSNLLVRVPASSGRGSAPTVVLQAHLDMVCERDPASAYDPAAGKIGLVLEGDWLRADGTTLGADNGVGVAAMQAVAENDAPHGPLELLFTTGEEIGLRGAGVLDGAAIGGRLLLNLDGQEDGVLTIGCAGAADTCICVANPRAPALETETALRVTVSGATGGHSGMDIARGRANAVKQLAVCLRSVHETAPFRLASLDGGASRNAIARAASATILVSALSSQQVRTALRATGRDMTARYAQTDPGVQLEVLEQHGVPDAWLVPGTTAILDLLVALPDGPLAMSPSFADLVETSTSLNVVSAHGDVLELRSLMRTSGRRTDLNDTLDSLRAVAHLAGGRLDVGHTYPAWRPEPSSPLLATCAAVWRRLYGSEPRVAVAHVGLEPALIGRVVPGIDMLACGPRIESPHSPGERVSVPSVARFWGFLLATLDALST